MAGCRCKNNLAVRVLRIYAYALFAIPIRRYVLTPEYVKCTVDDFPESHRLPPCASATPNRLVESHAATIYYVPLLRRRPFRIIPFQFPCPAALIRDREKKRKRENIWRCLSYTYRDCADVSFDLSSFLFLRRYILLNSLAIAEHNRLHSN